MLCKHWEDKSETQSVQILLAYGVSQKRSLQRWIRPPTDMTFDQQYLPMVIGIHNIDKNILRRFNFSNTYATVSSILSLGTIFITGRYLTITSQTKLLEWLPIFLLKISISTNMLRKFLHSTGVLQFWYFRRLIERISTGRIYYVKLLGTSELIYSESLHSLPIFRTTVLEICS